MVPLTGHGGIIYSLSWSPNSQWLVSASNDGSALVWHIPHSAAGIPSPRTAALLSPYGAAPLTTAGGGGGGGSLGAGAGGSGSTSIPSRPYCSLVASPPSYVYAAAFHSAAPHLVVTAGYDGGLRVWDAKIQPDVRAAHFAFSALAPARGGALAQFEGGFLGFIGTDPRAAAQAAGPRT